MVGDKIEMIEEERDFRGRRTDLNIGTILLGESLMSLEDISIRNIESIDNDIILPDFFSKTLEVSRVR